MSFSSIALRSGLAASALVLCLTDCSSTCPAGTVMEGATCRGALSGDADAAVSRERSATEAAPAAGGQGAAGRAKPDAPITTGTAGAGTTPSGGASGASGAGASNSAGAGSTVSASANESCTPAAEGGLRCAKLGGGKRERCSGGQWVASDACAPGEACVASAPSQTACMAMLELCKGSGGGAVCDPMGTLYVCNADATVSHQEVCPSARLCQASVAEKSCLVCTPQVDHKCEGRTLQVCAADGKSWSKVTDCDTEALCNETLGMCTTAVCEPGKFVCESNMLKQCNAAGTGFESNPEACGADTCDAEGGQCDTCQPAMKSCGEGGMLLTCNADGQGATPTPCPGGMKCVGAGQCVACTADAECGSLSQNCRVGVCSNYNCTVANAADGMQCSLPSGSGVCQGGTCTCVPKCAGKACGDSGCPGQPCPNTCGARMCYRDACVDCVTSADCSQLNDDCNTGTCSAGRCVATPASRSCRDSKGATSFCANGRCPECVRDCSRKCGGESDGCGGTCPNPCSNGTQCSAGKCQECTPGQTGCKGNLSDGTPGGCTSDLAGCFFAWTNPNVVSQARCDASGHWTFQLCSTPCLLSNGVSAFECATVGGTSQCINSGTCVE